MPSHLSSIGFPTATQDAFYGYVKRAVEQGDVITTSGGRYIVWTPGEGIQLWVQVDRSDRMVGLHPHFAGQARMRVALTERVMRLDDSILVGAFQGWAEPSGDDPESGSYPFVFDVPDYDRYHSLELPVVLGVQVAAFAHKLEAYASDEAYYAAQHREPKFAAESFIPSGLFTLGGEAMTPPQALAILTGHVLDTALLTNPATGATFHWAWVRTLGGEVDVAADPEVPTGSLVPGGVISGSFWLSGRLLNYT